MLWRLCQQASVSGVSFWKGKTNPKSMKNEREGQQRLINKRHNHKKKVYFQSKDFLVTTRMITLRLGPVWIDEFQLQVKQFWTNLTLKLAYHEWNALAKYQVILSLHCWFGSIYDMPSLSASCCSNKRLEHCAVNHFRPMASCLVADFKYTVDKFRLTKMYWTFSRWISGRRYHAVDLYFDNER